jgi:D-alanyl-D-alanine carboxypeptidase (penicillin-binding protein 5/6)
MRWGTALAAALVLASTASAASGAAPTFTARAAIVVNAASGEVLWAKNADQPLPPASTTKVLTAILALESGRLDESFPVSRFASQTAPSRIGLLPGQRMALRNLLYALLLNSANDAATVVAEGLAGSQSAFAARMTERAHALGARTARFQNPHGLTAAGHVASARDLAVVFRHALRLPLFREVLETRAIEVPVEARAVRRVSLRSHNRLLKGYRYPVIGKTGYTRAARRCFVGAANDDQHEIVVALLGATDLWGDTRRLVEYGLDLAAGRPSVLMAGVLPTPSVARRSKTRRETAEGDDEPVAARSEPQKEPPLRYAVQLGPYRSRQTAEATRAKLSRRGYSAWVAGRALRVGRFETRTGAAKAAARLRVSGYRPTTIVALH